MKLFAFLTSMLISSFAFASATNDALVTCDGLLNNQDLGIFSTVHVVFAKTEKIQISMVYDSGAAYYGTIERAANNFGWTLDLVATFPSGYKSTMVGRVHFLSSARTSEFTGFSIIANTQSTAHLNGLFKCDKSIIEILN